MTTRQAEQCCLVVLIVCVVCAQADQIGHNRLGNSVKNHYRKRIGQSGGAESDPLTQVIVHMMTSRREPSRAELKTWQTSLQLYHRTQRSKKQRMRLNQFIKKQRGNRK